MADDEDGSARRRQPTPRHMHMLKHMFLLKMTMITTMWCTEAVSTASITSAKKIKVDETAQPLMLSVIATPRSTATETSRATSPTMTTPVAGPPLPLLHKTPAQSK
eukprot:TRINITY_DN95071_c0_g1_i1.p2 TRINITY_DN95071_c0_g1~~TRINITY_DN95071_c0_g1_i1.p2  ORF type:complete len:106 (+),score=11.80 TRINITY_DN95071_c0_g1_i1:90-407(+)